MRVSPEFAKGGIGLLFLFALGLVVWQEWGSTVNPGKPLPRPCKLLLPSFGFTGLYVGATFTPSIAFWVTAGLVTGSLIGGDQGFLKAINTTLGKAGQIEQQAG